MKTQLEALAQGVALVLGLAIAVQARAADGVVLIDQAKAMAGGVTPGDTPDWPVFITRSGSYRLASDLVIDKLDHPDVIVVTSDLQARAVSIRNGQIRGMAGAAVGLLEQDARVSDMVVSHSGSMGIGIKSGTLRNNTSQFNGGEGFVARGAVIAIGNQAISNGTDGLHFFSSTGSLVTGTRRCAMAATASP